MLVVLAKTLFGLDLQVDRVAWAATLQRIFDDLEQVIATNQKLHRIVQHIQFFAQGVGECPAQGGYALFSNFHT